MPKSFIYRKHYDVLERPLAFWPDRLISNPGLATFSDFLKEQRDSSSPQKGSHWIERGVARWERQAVAFLSHAIVLKVVSNAVPTEYDVLYL